MFAILISTKNRKLDLIFTLEQIKSLIERVDVTCVVYDDGSVDGTFEAIQNLFPQINIMRNEISKGYLYCRNILLNKCKSQFAISLDDDAHFLSNNPLELIKTYFNNHPKCGLIAFRLFWNTIAPKNFLSTENPQQVKGFVGCGHVWNMKAWRDIPNYPEWFQFYGEEEFAAIQLYKKSWEVHYLPEILVQHRVDLKLRTQKNNDFSFRYRRSIRSGWYLYFLFYPIKEIPKKMAYSLLMQFKTKILKGNFKVVLPLTLAFFDLLINLPNIINNRNKLSDSEYQKYAKLKETKIYWNPEN